MKKNCSFVLALFLSLCLLSGCTSLPELSHGDLPMNSDVPSVDKDSAQQIENNKPMDNSSSVNNPKVDSSIPSVDKDSSQQIENNKPTDNSSSVNNPKVDSGIPSVDKDSAQQIENNKPTDNSSSINESELNGKVSMTVSADAAGSLDITITNNSDVDIDMGQAFSLQKMGRTTWEDIPLSLSYTDDLIVISPNESYTFHENIGIAGILESNTTYQIAKVVSAGKTNHSVFASFQIK